MITHEAFPELAEQEDEFNAILARRPNPDGSVRRVCLHVDRTVAHSSGWPGWGTTSSCDYCGQTCYDNGTSPLPSDMMPVEYLVSSAFGPGPI